MTLGVLLSFLICHILTLAAPPMQGYFRDLEGVSLKVVGSDCTHMQRPAWDATARHGILWAGAWQMCGVTRPDRGMFSIRVGRS